MSKEELITRLQNDLHPHLVKYLELSTTDVELIACSLVGCGWGLYNPSTRCYSVKVS